MNARETYIINAVTERVLNQHDIAEEKLPAIINDLTREISHAIDTAYVISDTERLLSA